LVIEDEKVLLKAIKIRLEDFGFSVVQAESYQQAIEKIEGDQIDLIWLDHYLIGEKDGLDFMVYIRAKKKFKNIPVYLITNTCSSDKYENYKQLGIKKYYMKSDVELGQVVGELAKAYR